MELGKYKHFKGGEYEVIGVGRHSEDLKEFVVYKGDSGLWVRPLELFTDEVTRDGETFPRFKKI